MKTCFKPPKWLLIIALPFFAAQLFGQNTNKTTPQYRYGLKAYLSVLNENTLDIFTNTDGNIITTRQKNTTFLPSVGIFKQRKKGVFSELDITHLTFNKVNSETNVQLLYTRDSMGNLVPISGIDVPYRGAKTWTSHIGIRYEWNFPLFFEKLGFFQPYIGVSTDPSVYYQKIDPFTTASFPSIKTEASNTFSVIPRLVFNASSRLFFDINVPISVFRMAVTYNYTGNPILPTYARRITDFSAKAFPAQLNIRLGIGYRI